MERRLHHAFFMTGPATSLRPGDHLRVRGERWRVLHVAPQDTCAILHVTGAERTNRGETARFLLPFEPADRLPSATECPRLVGRAAWRRVARAALAEATPTWTSLRAAARATLTLLPYQLEPALAMTRGIGCRFLLADDVGLGKTIQAGLMIAELLARERNARILVVTPAGLREQWRDELRDRFAIDADVLDAGALARCASRLPPGVNPWAVTQVAIASIDFLKRADVVRSLEALVWDLVAFDEAHAMSGRSDRALAAELVARRGRRVVAVTATPHSGDDRAFERLCGVGRFGPGDRLLVFRRSRADAGVPGARSLRLLHVRPTREELLLHRAIAAYGGRVAHEPAAGPAAHLALMVLTRRACSSAASLARSVERRMALLDDAGQSAASQLRLPLDDTVAAEDDEPLAELAAPGLADRGLEQRWLARILTLARGVTRESKMAALARLLRRAAEPAIVFTEYRDTLQRLAGALPAGAAFLHGGLTAAERAREARRFTHGDAMLLLATDAASEGLNLHHRCRLVINLEVPWTPLRLEQRIGRVDRLGQRRRVHAVAFVARGTSDARVVQRLDARSTRASRGAPFGEVASAAPPDVTAPDLRRDAELEADRLRQSRCLMPTRRATPAGPDRPVMAPIRHQGTLWLALRMLFVDSADALVWETIAAAGVAAGAAPHDSAESLRAWFESVMRANATPLAVAATHLHESLLARLRDELRGATAALLVREQAILERLHTRNGRLAAPLVQAGLFDRRAIRHADAQQRLVDDAAARAAERVAAVKRMQNPAAAERRLVFTVVR